MGASQFFRKYQKIAAGAGVLAACGILIYEKYKINKFLGNLIDINVLEIDKKRPDYIYIKYHIYRESMRKLREKEQDKNWINIIIHPIGKWVKTFKHSVAWRLLKIAQGDDKHERLKAVRQLARLDHLKDWDFRHLAQICDARTAVSLARSECDRRWFLPIHKKGLVRNPKLVLSDIRNILCKVSPSFCVDNFLEKHMDIKNIQAKEIDEYFPIGTALIRREIDLLKECVGFFHHITKNVEYSEKVIREGGLAVLKDLLIIFNKDNETLTTLCKIIANLSQVDNCVEHFFVTGWVGILSQWMHHPDVRLQVISAKALENLDYDDPYRFKYPPSVYALYPRSRRRQKPTLDIVFIHGLLGGVFITWRQKDRNQGELALYGKNAFYTSETDDIFIVGETKHVSSDIKTDLKDKDMAAGTHTEKPRINKRRTVKSRSDGISDAATKELVETLETAEELGPDWEVVYPDCPLKCTAGSGGQFSISGEKWINDDNSDDYTNCWPMDWLPEDYPNIRILGIEYQSAVSQWSATYAKNCPCEKALSYMDERAKCLLDRITASSVGQNRPVVWVGHSMGGILCKHILLKAVESTDKKCKRLALNTKGIVFLGTPHRGSSIARWKQHMQVILSPSIEVKELEEDSPKLKELHNRFMTRVKSYFSGLEIVSIAEGRPTMLTTFKFPLRIVTEESAYMSYGDFYVLKDDHLSLSKPIFRQSFLYRRLMKVIDDCLASGANVIEEEVNENDDTVILQKNRKVQVMFDNLFQMVNRLIKSVK